MADFTRSRPGNFPPNGTLSSAEISDIDRKTAKALNRFGGTIAVGTGPDDGVVTVASGATIEVAAGGEILVHGGANAFVMNESAELRLLDTAVVTVAGGGGINLTGAGASVALQTGTFLELLAGSQTQLAGHLDVNSGGVLTVDSGGILKLTDQWPALNTGHPGRTRTVALDLAAFNGAMYGTGWTSTVDGLSGPATLNSLEVILAPPHNGATLSSVDLLFTPSTGHSSTLLPATNVTMALRRRSPAVGGALPTRSTLGSPAIYAPVSASDYKNGLIKLLTWSASPVVNSATDCFSILLTDESGSNSLAGNIFHELRLNYTAIADTRFQ